MYTVYVLAIFLAILIAYAGIDETMKLLAYLDLQLRYAYVKIQMKWMGWNLKRQLVKETTEFQKFYEKFNNEHKNLF